MNLLTDDEILSAVRGFYGTSEGAAMGSLDDIQTARAVEAAILAKLASAELPEPFPAGYISQTEYFYTADQYNQAFAQGFAQGAASQLADKPCAFLHTWADGEKLPLLHDRDCRINDQPIAVEPLFTRKEPK